MEPNRPVSAVALVDSSPILLLPSAFALKQAAGNCPVRISLLAPPHYQLDVTFVYDNCLYLLSCKNDAVQERFFPHLDRFRALVAEFGESRTRPVLLSTAPLQRRHLERCASFEIGAISGTALLACLQASLNDRPDALLRNVIQVSQQAPRAGLA